MLPQNSAHIRCLNEADAFLDIRDGECKELIRLFILTGYNRIVIKSWSARPIACFVRGNERTRAELLARYISTRSQNWGTTFGMFRCFFGAAQNEHPLTRAFRTAGMALCAPRPCEKLVSTAQARASAGQVRTQNEHVWTRAFCVAGVDVAPGAFRVAGVPFLTHRL